VPGVSYYRGDSIEQFNHWVTIKQVANWNKEYVAAQSINYVLNHSFENNLEKWAVGSGKGIEIATGQAKAGKKFLRATFPDKLLARQIIDRGFFPDKSALHVSAWFDTSRVSPDGAISIEIQINYIDGAERSYNIPIPIATKAGWHEVQADLALGNSNDLKFIIISLKGAAASGTLYVDDVRLNLTEKQIDPEKFSVSVATSDSTVPAESVNLARGQIVLGSSIWLNGFDYDNAVDGDFANDNSGKGSVWHSQRPPFDQWIKIYLPTTALISKFRLLNASVGPGYRTKEYKIEVSTDELHYKQVAKGTLPNDGQKWTEIEIKPTQAKYIKFTGITGYTTTHAVGLKEIEIY